MSAAALDVRAVWKYFGDFPALRAVTLGVARGECLAMLGRNGAGKTTLLKILAGQSSPSQGDVSVFGQAGRTEAARRKTGVLGHGIGIYD
ncbi:MAG TPA: ATP-binding cassette domain-containing protein, partial [Bryobacteraceae bacterium]|nr:ATP-binding cassette domain-containing protein [Bryobacteraceae bacterium]